MGFAAHPFFLSPNRRDSCPLLAAPGLKPTKFADFGICDYVCDLVETAKAESNYIASNSAAGSLTHLLPLISAEEAA
jgi:hypothetical protein